MAEAMKTNLSNLNRRQFLKLTAAGTSVAALGFPTIIPSRVLGAGAPSKLIQIAQIGCGRIATDMDMAIAIRTALVREGRAYVQAGGGIVADSDPDYEYNESVNKALAVLRAVAIAETVQAP